MMTMIAGATRGLLHPKLVYWCTDSRACLPRRTRRMARRASSDIVPDVCEVPELSDAEAVRLFRAWRSRTIAVTAVALMPLLIPQAANAWTEKPWMPRRHHVSMKEAREAPSWKAVKPERAPQQAPAPEQGAFEKLSQQMRSVFNAQEETVGFSMRETSSSSAVPGTRAIDSRTFTMSHAGTSAGYRPAAAPTATAGWLAFAVVLGAAVFFFATRRGASMLKGLFGARKNGDGGRWVRDRSLGGKMVWIPDAPAASASTSATFSPLATPDEVREATAAPRLRSQASKQPSAEAPQSARPPWWVDLPRFQVPKYAALESKKRAHKLLRELEDSKIAGGQDFGLLGLINLQRVCREGNVDLSNRFGAVATRDSMLRVAIQEVIKQVAASGGGSERAGGLTMPPREFVCGLSVSIGVPEPRTVTIVHAAIAADARARLLQIAAALRTGRPEQAAAEMAALRAILTSFPMPDSAPEAELVGAGLRDKFTTSEMESVLKEMAFEMPSQMSLFVVLLGFDREVTVPYLEQYVADRKAGKV